LVGAKPEERTGHEQAFPDREFIEPGAIETEGLDTLPWARLPGVHAPEDAGFRWGALVYLPETFGLFTGAELIRSVSVGPFLQIL
jgi:hypothetical protein